MGFGFLQMSHDWLCHERFVNGENPKLSIKLGYPKLWNFIALRLSNMAQTLHCTVYQNWKKNKQVCGQNNQNFGQQCDFQKVGKIILSPLPWNCND